MLTNVSDVTVTYFIYRKIIQIAFQTELTCQRIQEFETQASSDLELRNNKIDELNRVSAGRNYDNLFMQSLSLSLSLSLYCSLDHIKHSHNLKFIV